MTRMEESRGCICYCCPSTGAEVSSMKVEAVHPSNWQGDAPMSNGDSIGGLPLKSNLKKPCGSSKQTTSERCTTPNGSPVREFNTEAEQSQEDPNCKVKRKVQWTDAHGKELTQVKEFERRISGKLVPDCSWTMAIKVLQEFCFGFAAADYYFDLGKSCSWRCDTFKLLTMGPTCMPDRTRIYKVIHIDLRMKA